MNENIKFKTTETVIMYLFPFLLIGAICLIYYFPKRITRGIAESSQKIELVNKLRTSWAQIAGGVGFILTLGISYIGIRANNDQFIYQAMFDRVQSRIENRHQLFVNQQNIHTQLTTNELLAKTQLESTKESVRGQIESALESSNAMKESTLLQRELMISESIEKSFLRAMETLTTSVRDIEVVIAVHELVSIGKSDPAYLDRVAGVIKGFLQSELARESKIEVAVNNYIDSAQTIVTYNPLDQFNGELGYQVINEFSEVELSKWDSASFNLKPWVKGVDFDYGSIYIFEKPAPKDYREVISIMRQRMAYMKYSYILLPAHCLEIGNERRLRSSTYTTLMSNYASIGEQYLENLNLVDLGIDVCRYEKCYDCFGDSNIENFDYTRGHNAPINILIKNGNAPGFHLMAGLDNILRYGCFYVGSKRNDKDQLVAVPIHVIKY